MELRCVQTQINIILKKIISIYYLDFDRSSREGPAGPDSPSLIMIAHNNWIMFTAAYVVPTGPHPAPTSGTQTTSLCSCILHTDKG